MGNKEKSNKVTSTFNHQFVNLVVISCTTKFVEELYGKYILAYIYYLKVRRDMLTHNNNPLASEKMEDKKQWETPVLLDLDMSESESMAFPGSGDADSGPKAS